MKKIYLIAFAITSLPLLNCSNSVGSSYCNTYMDKHGLERNPVVDLLHMSGECLCGAFARKDAMQELELWFPETAEYIHGLERKVEATGHVNCLWGWPAQYAATLHPAQGHLFSPLCVGCEPPA